MHEMRRKSSEEKKPQTSHPNNLSATPIRASTLGPGTDRGRYTHMQFEIEY